MAQRLARPTDEDELERADGGATEASGFSFRAGADDVDRRPKAADRGPKIEDLRPRTKDLRPKT